MKKDNRLYLRINSDLKSQLEEIAKTQNRTLSNLIETILKKEIEKREGNINMKDKEIKKIINKYNEQGIGFNCNTNELKELQRMMRQNKDILKQNIEYCENRKKELYNVEISNSALDVVRRDLRDNELNEINKEINLIVIALTFNSIEEFINEKLK